MIKKLTRIGNSHGLVLDKAILELMGLEDGDSVQISLEGRRLVAEPVRRPAELDTVGDVLKGITDRHDQAFTNLAK